MKIVATGGAGFLGGHAFAAVVAECPAPLSFGEPRAGDIALARGSGAKARSLLGWTPQVSFAEGLHDLIEHHRSAAW